VRLRLPHRFDVEPLRALHRRVGIEPDDLALHRALRFDPRRQLALVATILVGRTEEIVGLVLVERDSGEPAQLVSDEQLAPGIRALLEAAVARSAAWPPKQSLAWSR